MASFLVVEKCEKIREQKTLFEPDVRKVSLVFWLNLPRFGALSKKCSLDFLVLLDQAKKNKIREMFT